MAKSEQSWWSWATGWATGGGASKTEEFKPPTGEETCSVVSLVELTTYTVYEYDKGRLYYMHTLMLVHKCDSIPESASEV